MNLLNWIKNIYNKRFYSQQLIKAIKTDDNDLLCAMLSKSVNPNAAVFMPDDILHDKKVPLFVALHQNNIEALKILLESGANPKKRHYLGFGFGAIEKRHNALEYCLLLTQTIDVTPPSVVARKPYQYCDQDFEAYKILRKHVPLPILWKEKMQYTNDPTLQACWAWELNNVIQKQISSSALPSIRRM